MFSLYVNISLTHKRDTKLDYHTRTWIFHKVRELVEKRDEGIGNLSVCSYP